MKNVLLLFCFPEILTETLSQQSLVQDNDWLDFTDCSWNIIYYILLVTFIVLNLVVSKIRINISNHFCL